MGRFEGCVNSGRELLPSVDGGQRHPAESLRLRLLLIDPDFSA